MSNDTTLLIEFALDASGHLIDPKQAVKGEAYFCPECNSPLVFRKGEVLRPHFAHAVETNCSGESVLHIAAKMKVCDAINDYISNGGYEVDLAWNCPKCRLPTAHTIGKTATYCTTEKTLETGHRIDVALMDGDKCILCIEILNTHKVDDEKAQALNESGYYWAEVLASDVVASPHYLIATRSNLPICYPCKHTAAAIQSETPRLIQKYDIQHHESMAPVVVQCWRCRSAYVAFEWESDATPNGRPPYPIPWTVSFQWVKAMKERVWVNCCPECYATLSPYKVDHAHGEWINSKGLHNSDTPY